MKIIGVIPARLNSTRLAEKVLQKIDGIPMIQHVWQRVKQASSLDEVVIACEHERVLKCVEDFGGKAMMTSVDHPNGSSRVAEVAAAKDADVFINIQGDEPLIDFESIDRLGAVFQNNSDVQVATLAVKKNDREDYENPNVVKVVCDANKDALYFSRSPLPFFRESKDLVYYKHLGIYGYRKDFLLNFVEWESGELEDLEKLEQLRILERGHKIRVEEALSDSLSVDTAEDLEMVEKELKQRRERVS